MPNKEKKIRNLLRPCYKVVNNFSSFSQTRWIPFLCVSYTCMIPVSNHSTVKVNDLSFIL